MYGTKPSSKIESVNVSSMFSCCFLTFISAISFSYFSNRNGFLSPISLLANNEWNNTGDLTIYQHPITFKIALKDRLLGVLINTILPYPQIPTPLSPPPAPTPPNQNPHLSQ